MHTRPRPRQRDCRRRARRARGRSLRHRARQQIGVAYALHQWPSVAGEHIRHEHGVERENATLDRRHLTFDPVAQDGIDGDLTLAQCTLFPFAVVDTIAPTTPWVLFQVHGGPAFGRGAQLHCTTTVLEREYDLVRLVVVHEADRLAAEAAAPW